MHIGRIIFFAAPLVLGSPAFPQGSSTQAITQAVPASPETAIQETVQALASAAKDKLLIRDLLGAEVAGPDGSTVGTIEDFVVLPGGRLVAAIISTGTNEGGLIPVPYSMVKVMRTAGQLGLALPVTLSELKAMSEIQALAQQIPSLR